MCAWGGSEEKLSLSQLSQLCPSASLRWSRGEAESHCANPGVEEVIKLFSVYDKADDCFSGLLVGKLYPWWKSNVLDVNSWSWQAFQNSLSTWVFASLSILNPVGWRVKKLSRSSWTLGNGGKALLGAKAAMVGCVLPECPSLFNELKLQDNPVLRVNATVVIRFILSIKCQGRKWYARVPEDSAWTWVLNSVLQARGQAYPSQLLPLSRSLAPWNGLLFRLYLPTLTISYLHICLLHPILEAMWG